MSANSYIEAAVAAHRSSLNGSLPLEIKSESPSAVTAWFAGKVPFNFRLPEAPEEAAHEQVCRLAGGRLINYKDGHAALVSYQMQQQTISLLVSSSKSAAAAGGKEVLSGGIVFHYSKQMGFAVITWSTHGFTYALVSSLPGSGRRVLYGMPPKHGEWRQVLACAPVDRTTLLLSIDPRHHRARQN